MKENNSNMKDEETDNVIVLSDDEGNEYRLVLLGLTEYEEKMYAVLMPEDQEITDDEEQEVPLIVMETSGTDDDISFELVEDETVGNAVLEKYMAEAEEEEGN